MSDHGTFSCLLHSLLLPLLLGKECNMVMHTDIQSMHEQGPCSLQTLELIHLLVAICGHGWLEAVCHGHLHQV